MFLNLDNFNEDFASKALSAEVSGVDVSTPGIPGLLFAELLPTLFALFGICSLPSLFDSQ